MKASLFEIREAHIGLHGIGASALPAKAAFRVARLSAKLKAVIADFDATQTRIFLDAGGKQVGNGVQLEPPAKGADEADEAFASRVTAFREKAAGLNAQLKALLDEEVEIDADPIPLSLFGDVELKPNDIVFAGQFLKE